MTVSVLSRAGLEGWLEDPGTNQPQGTVVLPTAMKGTMSHVRLSKFTSHLPWSDKRFRIFYVHAAVLVSKQGAHIAYWQQRYEWEGRVRRRERTINFEYLDAELQEKAKACKTPEELLKLAADEGYELSDEQIESISGGLGDWGSDCQDWCDDCPEHKSRRRYRLK